MILDTSGLLCLLNKAEPLHRKACEYYRAANVLLTHNYILAEFIALSNARGLPRKITLNFMADLLKNPEIEVPLSVLWEIIKKTNGRRRKSKRD